MSLYSATENLKRNLRASRKAIIGRGGEVSATAGLKDLPKAIFDIPADASLAFYEDSEVKYRKIVPEKSEEYAMVKALGGMTYKSKNLIPYPDAKTSSGVTFTVEDDGTITLNGTATASTSFVLVSYRDKTLRLRGGVTYTFSCKSNLTDDTGYAYLSHYVDGTLQKTITRQNAYTAYTPSSDGYESIAIVVKSGAEFVNEKVVLQLEEGDTATDYEPYFEGLRDSKVTELVSEGANLAPSQEYGVHIPCALKANTQYVVSVANPVSEGMQLLFYDENKTRIANVAVGLEDANTGRRYRTFTLSQDCAYIMWAWATVTTVNEGQIEYGSTPSAYKPYIGTVDTKAIPEAVQALDGYGWGVNAEYNNRIVWRDGRVYFVKNSIHKIFNGTESWSDELAGTDTDLRAVTQIDGLVKGVGICNKYPFGNAANVGEFDASSGYWLRFNCYGLATTVDEWKALLAQWNAEGKPLEVVYALETPIETDITHLFTEDNFLKVEGGGSIVAVNEYEYAVPSEIAYVKQVDESGGGEGDAYELGYQTGYGDGFSEGKTEGYASGYSTGKEDGKTENYDTFWDAYQNNGRRGGYSYAFYGVGWSDITFKPKHNIIPNSSTREMFRYCLITNLRAILQDLNVTLDTSNITNLSYFFGGSPNLIATPDIDCSSATDLSSLYSGCTVIKTISLYNILETATVVNMFMECTELENLTIQGSVGNSLSLVYSKKLTKESITNVVNVLSANVTGKTLTLSQTAVNSAFETSSGANNGSTSSDWNNLVNTKTNWTITLTEV